MEDNLRYLSSYLLVKSPSIIQSDVNLATSVKYKGSYYSAINCVILPFLEEIFVISPVHSLKGYLATASLDGLKANGSIKFDQKKTFNSQLDFFLSISGNIENIQQESFVPLAVQKLFQIPEITEIINIFLNSGSVQPQNSTPTPKPDSPDYEDMPISDPYFTFDLFMLAKINRPQSMKQDITLDLLKNFKFNVLQENNIKLGDHCRIITNSLILNSYNLFKSRVHNAYISLIKEYKNLRVIWLGFNGVPNLEGSLVCNESLTGIIGII
jgi:hypothetical protein